MDEIEVLKQKVQILHERVEILEKAIASINCLQIRALSSEITNLKIALADIRYARDERP